MKQSLATEQEGESVRDDHEVNKHDQLEEGARAVPR